MAGIHGGGFDAEAAGFGSEEERGFAVDAAAEEDMVAGFQPGEEHGGEGTHAGGSDRAALGGVQLAELFGEEDGVGMAVALIDVAGFATGEQIIGLLGTGALPDAGEINGGRVGLRGLRRQRLRARADVGGAGHTRRQRTKVNRKNGLLV